MKNVKTYACLVKVMSYIFMLIIIGSFFVKWFFGVSTLPEVYHIFGFFNNYYLVNGLLPIADMPTINTLLGMAVDSISFGLLIAVFWYVAVLMKHIQCYGMFSSATVSLCVLISKLMFYFTLYTPINRALLSVITSMHNAPGNRVLTISLSSADLFAILICAALMVITALMHEGNSIKDEQQLTV